MCESGNLSIACTRFGTVVAIGGHQAPGRHITILLDGQTMLSQTLASAGSHTLTTASFTAKGDDVQLTITIDKTFQAPNDNRRLGLILAAAGFTSK